MLDFVAPVDLTKAQFYARAARSFAARGQTLHALQLYQKAEALNDAAIDAEACKVAIASPDHSAPDLELLMRRWSFKHAAPAYNVVYGVFDKRPRKNPIRIGYHCNAWGTRSIRAGALPIISKHDKTQFHTVGYLPFSEPQGSHDIFDMVRAGTARLDRESFARLVREDDIDIFVELSSLTPANRFGAMALRCAPIQVSYLGHLETSQVANVDYVIGDEIAFPTGLDLYFSERIHRLPRSFVSYNFDLMDMAELAAPPFLEKGYITFVGFGSPTLLNSECLSLWAAVLQAVPNSRLLIRSEGMTKKSNTDFIMRRLQRHGIDDARIVVAPSGSRDNEPTHDHSADIALDSWPESQGASIAEALWHGVPAVTLHGPRATAAHGASVLHAVGLSDLVAKTAQRYVAIASSLASDHNRLRTLRSNLRSMVRASELTDTEHMVRTLEQAYRGMVSQKMGDTNVVVFDRSRAVPAVASQS